MLDIFCKPILISENFSSIYISTMPEYNGNDVDAQFLYNAITYKHSQSPDAVSDDSQNILPSEYILYSNFPNPFNATTHIRFYLPIRSSVVLSIYDMKGRLIEDIIRQNMPPGNHVTRWNANEYPSGEYFIKFKANTYEQIHKCLLLK
ncbi:T9SS type A sorting domain-containing protein [candidate division KSB1 bacterium]|nr:T9SS type A sorting domain-containing protein [candidate division KSB1 bacterium]